MLLGRESNCIVKLEISVRIWIKDFFKTQLEVGNYSETFDCNALLKSCYLISTAVEEDNDVLLLLGTKGFKEEF